MIDAILRCTTSHLKEYIKTVHDNIKDVKCTKCDYTFSTTGNLKRHIQEIHTNPKTKGMSRGEKTIFDHLMKTDYEFNKTFFREVSFYDFKGINDGLLRCDFKVMLDDEKFVLIEFGGMQHFQPVKFGSKTASESLET